MSWQVASMGCVLIALAAGFAWYERSRPSSKLIALVAVLAAVAVAGRVVFAPIPNVQATTDIVLLAGYALGAAPGFAVGAVAALASNFFLGQGPWTPWQMLGWGAIGLAGATFAGIRGRTKSRASPGRCGPEPPKWRGRAAYPLFPSGRKHLGGSLLSSRYAK